MSNKTTTSYARKDHRRVDSLKFVVVKEPIKSHHHCSHLYPQTMFFGLLSKNIKEIETTLTPFFTGGRNQLTQGHCINTRHLKNVDKHVV
jgi:hypothetical protein